MATTTPESTEARNNNAACDFTACMVAIVTGGAMGIGEATVRKLVQGGGRVVIADIAEAEGHALAKQLEGKAAFQRCDVTVEADIEAAITFAETTFGPLTVFVNNAGIAGGLTSIEEMDVKTFERTIQINLISALMGTKHAARAMRAAETPGAIVNISSVAGLRGGLGYVDYVCSKAALTVLTQQAACELANAGIRVNSVAAAYVSTPMTAEFLSGGKTGAEGEAAIQRNLDNVTAFKGHTPTATDIANSVAWLCGSGSAACTGMNLIVDGGLMTGVAGRLATLVPTEITEMFE